MATEKRKVLSVSAITSEGVAEINGKEHNVRALTFDEHHKLDSATAKDSVNVVRECVKAVCPTLSDEEVGALSLDQGQAILTLAGSGIAGVEALFPNAVRLERK